MTSTQHLCLLTATLASISSLAAAEKPVGASGSKPPGAPSNVRIKATATPRTTLATWSEIAGFTFARRDAFLAGLRQLEIRVDDQIRDLIARRALLKSASDLQAWDRAMKEMARARSDLKMMGEELRLATPETWQQQKNKVGEIWARTQEAYQKVELSTMR